jgi:hypothetical protein
MKKYASARRENRRLLQRTANGGSVSDGFERPELHIWSLDAGNASDSTVVTGRHVLAIIFLESMRSNTERHGNKKTSADKLQRLVRFELNQIGR